MKLFKEIFKAQIAGAVITLAVGLGLLIFPEFFAATVCYILGILAIIFAAVNIVSYISSPISFFGLGSGIAALLLGILLITRHNSIISILPLCVGLFMLADSISKIVRALDLKNQGFVGWRSILIPACVTLALSVILILFPFGSTMVLLRIIGAFLIYTGIENIYHYNYIRKKIEKETPIEGSFTDDDR